MTFFSWIDKHNSKTIKWIHGFDGDNLWFLSYVSVCDEMQGLIIVTLIILLCDRGGGVRNGGEKAKKAKIFRRCTKKSIKQKFLSSIICGWIHEWRGNMQISNKNGLFSPIYMYQPAPCITDALHHNEVRSRVFAWLLKN